MITSVTIKNFKRFESVTVPLSESIVLAGPNNSGKTTAIQALAVWRLALTRWLEKRGGKLKSKAKQRTGVPITRPDMTAVPTREMKLLWNLCKVIEKENKSRLIEILVEGITGEKEWQCGMELQYQGPEMLYCRPMRIAPGRDERMDIPPEAKELIIAHLPPLAGLQLIEERVDERVLLSRISEGRAGDILRNLLFNVKNAAGGGEDCKNLTGHIMELFQVELLPPEYLTTGEIRVEYYTGPPNRNGHNPNPKLDIANGGSGFHQVLLILAFLYGRRASVLLFDEPDAHLEIIRQKNVYKLLQDIARQRNAQILISTHSEVILDETPHNNILAFLGDTPHLLTSHQQVAQLRKSLSLIPSSDYLLAELRGSVLYVEDYTDVDILKRWANIIGHRAHDFLESPFAVYVGNVPTHAREHFYGLREAYPKLKGLLLIDNTDTKLEKDGALVEIMWTRREIENYLLIPDAILRFCKRELERVYGESEPSTQSSLFAREVQRKLNEAQELLQRMLPPEVFADPLRDTEYVLQVKTSDAVFERFFKEFFSRIKRYNTVPNNQLYKLAEVMREDELHPEIREKLDAIAVLA